jgi:hypothetical protein
MRTWLKVSAAAACLTTAALLPAQTEKTEVRRDGPRPNEVEVRLTDTSTIRMIILQETVEVETQFGRLTVPSKHIRRIEFGLRLPEDLARKIDAAIKKFGGDSFDQREAAVKELISIGAPAYPALRDAADSPDAETAQRAKAAMRKIRESTPAAQLPTTLQDRVETTAFTMVGRIVTPAVKGRWQKGEVEFLVSELRAIRWLSANTEVAVTVDAIKYGAGNNQWMDTGVLVETDVGLQITASGQVNLNQDGGGEFVTGPMGNANWGRRGPYAPGALLGRVGDKGNVFMVGEKYEGTPNQEGKLYLQIAPSPWNQSTGNYKVKILTGRSLGNER